MLIKKCHHCKQAKTINNFYTYKPKARNNCYIENICKYCKKKQNRSKYSSNNYFKKKYGLTYQQVQNLGTMCKICGRSEVLYVDHNHSTGKVRGRLCRECNSGLGFFSDRIEYLKNAILYLECQKM